MSVLAQLDLSGKVAVVTGAGRGLGRAISLALADAGADLVVTARTETQIQETAALVTEKGRNARPIICDVTDSNSVNGMIADTKETFGRLDILINNAGGATPGMQNTLVDIEDKHWQVGVDTNLTGAMYCTRAAIPIMKEQRAGKIINVTSGFGLRVARDNFIYTSAKAGLINFTRALALTYAPEIQANLIAPGLFPHDNPAMIEWWRGGKFVPMGRLGRDEEIGQLAVVLASGLTSYMNGQIVVLDGGGLAGGHAPTGFAPVIPLAEEHR
ncbi:MAG TPA: SDR family oxidoreductase [Dehalococcoidia bacterium]|nr:SDR family oxidoreductase [Dehalococcoidia bacterium]